MKFIYLDYGKNFVTEIKKRNPHEDTIVVFSDYFLKNLYMKNKEKNILTPEAKYFTLEELQKKLFKTEKMILTEAKRPLTLFKVIEANLKLREKFEFQNYYDIIDFADLFFKYYKELFSACIEKAEELQEWQKEYIERFEILKEEYDKYLVENDFIPNDWIENIDNFTESFVRKFKKIIFVDIPYFTPLMREAIKRIDSILDVEIMVQIPKEDYNEREMKIEKVSLVKDKVDVKIYENSDEMSEILNLIYLLKINGAEKKDIFSPVPDKNNYHKIFPKYFVSQKLAVLDNTKLYQFMKMQNELLFSLEPKKRYGIPTEELEKALSKNIFRKIYNIDDTILEKFKKIFSAEYKYIDEKLFESSDIDYLLKDNSDEIICEGLPPYTNDIYQVFHKIYRDLMEIKEFTSVDEFVENIKKIGFEKFREDNYVDIIEKFYQAVDNIKSSERLCGAGGFKAIFETGTGANLYTLLIKYMEGIEIKEVERENSSVLGVVKNMNEARTARREKIYFTDIDNVSLPGNLKDNLNFTEVQRAKNGFMTFEEKKNIIKYRFVQGIFNSSGSVIFTKKNINKEIENSAFLEELMMRYKLTPQEKNPLSKDDIFNIIRENLLEKEGAEPRFMTEDYFDLERRTDDFEDKKIVLGTYETINLRDCQYKYFLANMGDIHGESEKKYGTSLRFLGIVTHKIFDEISKNIYMNIKKHNNFFLDENLVDKIIEKSLEENKMKIPTYMDLYFRDIMFPKIKENLFKFYREIEKDLGGKKVNIFWGEKSRTEQVPFFSNELDIFVVGRADLVAETEDGAKYIVDYKTGGKKAEQLDIYSIIMYGDESKALKRIYNVISGEYEKLDTVKITKAELIELFENLEKQGKYERASKKTPCGICEYQNICRREVV